MTEYEYGVMFVPPHRNAYEIVWCPDNLSEAVYLFSLGGSKMCRRAVGEVETL